MKTYEIYTDGSCKVATREKNGTCAIVVVDGQNIVHKQGYKYEDTTNNRMELMGCIQALKWVETNNTGRVYIHMDSQYVQIGITEWIAGWKKKGWKTANKKPVMNQDLWIVLDNLRGKLPMVQFQWVKGHNQNRFNEMADQLCDSSYSQVSEERRVQEAMKVAQQPTEGDQLLLGLRDQYRNCANISDQHWKKIDKYLLKHKLI